MTKGQSTLHVAFILYLLIQSLSGKPYAQLRSECAGTFCKNMDKQESLARDMCIHKCVHKDCYFQIYWDIDTVMPKFSNNLALKKEREIRKKEFMECLEEKGPFHQDFNESKQEM